MLAEAIFPKEVVADVPRITMIGTEQVRVEQHHGLAMYQPETILFRASGGQVRVTGKALRFLRYGAAEAVVTGEITGVTVEQVGKGGARA